MLTAWFVLLSSISSAANREPSDDAVHWLHGDAQLTDVTFVDADNGWAVGDHGAIWHTSDGGEHWQIQESNVDCRLTSVQFLDARTGWAAGGWSQPYTQVSQGVLLSTRDGGQHWQHERKMLLPALTTVRFLDKSHGWAIGRASSLFTSGVFSTEDGGRSWTSLPAPDTSASSTGPVGSPATVWTTGDFVDPTSGALAGPRGALATVRRRGTEGSPSADLSLRAWHRLQVFGPARAWAVGDGAWILRSEDLGKSWQTPPAGLPGNYRDHFDFHALAACGQRCWIAGAPGSKILHTADGGRTWSVQATGQPLPIRGLTFADDQNGWAVGDLGLILRTRDGGQTWRRQRAGGSRAAVLACFSTPAAMPLELFAKLSADEGYLAVAEILNRQDLEAPAGAPDLEARTHEAMVRAGANGSGLAWQFPLRQSGLNLSPEQTIDAWNRANDGQGLERLEAHIVQKIRQWRPSIVVTSAGDPAKNSSGNLDAAQQIVTHVVLRAVEHAADPTCFSEQITLAGLEPWKALKVYAQLPAGELGSANITTSQVASRWGRSLSELAAPARGLLTTAATAPEANVGFRLLIDHVPQDQGKRDFFSGIALSPGGEARRVLPEVNGQNLDELLRAAQSRRNLQAILARDDEKDNNSLSDSRWLAEIGELTRGLEANSGAEIIFQLAGRYYRRGRWQQAADSFELLAQRYPEHPLAGASLVWLVQYYSSGEAQWRLRRGQGRVARQAITVPNLSGPTIDRTKTDGGVKRVSAALPIQSAEQRSLLPDLNGNESWAGRAVAFAKQLEQLQPTLFAEPAVRFPLAAAYRAQGLSRQAERYYLSLQRARSHDAWWACAQGEPWLADPRGVAPKSIWTCQRATVRPRLDGSLNDPIWRSATPVELRSEHRDDGDWPAVAMAAFDAEYLYLALSCRPAPGAKYEGAAGPRPRDADLSRHDRVDIMIDLDRDWTTAYRMTIDHRGWTSEACWCDTTWNPNWYVAAKTDDGAWTAEAAIPLAELTGELPTAKSVWAIGVQRTVPGVGFQSWTRPASVDGQAEGFGYLIFE